LGVYDSDYNPQQPQTALAKLPAVLAERPLLIIADNLQYILPNRNARLAAEERQPLWDVLLALASRSGDSGSAKNAYPLATRLLDDLHINRRKAPYLARLKQLDYHPLAIQLVLPALERHILDTIRQDFAKRLNEFQDDSQSEGNRSLLVSLDYSLPCNASLRLTA
jgi:hypothetical protein